MSEIELSKKIKSDESVKKKIGKTKIQKQGSELQRRFFKDAG